MDDARSLLIDLGLEIIDENQTEVSPTLASLLEKRENILGKDKQHPTPGSVQHVIASRIDRDINAEVRRINGES